MIALLQRIIDDLREIFVWTIIILALLIMSTIGAYIWLRKPPS